MPLSHEKKFNSKGVPFRILIKKGEKWIVIEFFEKEFRGVPFANKFAKTCFARTYIALNADVFIGGYPVHLR